MIRIHVFNSDGYPLSQHVKKSFYSTISEKIVDHFLQQYSRENIVISHYMVLKEIHQNGGRINGVKADQSFTARIANADIVIESQCLLVEYSSGEVRAIDATDRSDDLLECTALPGFTGGMVFQYEKERFRNTIKDPKIQPDKLHPGYYGLRGYYTDDSDDVTQFEKYVTRKNSKLYFRGLQTNSVRKCLPHLAQHPETDVFDSPVDTESYFEELGSHKLALGLPGEGDLCFRDFEVFALKIPLLRPVFSVSLAQPLIPDHHYIGVNVRNCNDPVSFAEDIMKRYYGVIRDDSFLNFVSTNAYEYYSNYATYDSVALKCFQFLQPSKA